MRYPAMIRLDKSQGIGKAMTQAAMPYLKAPIVVTVCGLGAVALLSQTATNGGMEAVAFSLTALMLAVLEISLSFDNAVVDANRLEMMSEIWRRRFLTWGILIAVFGMRIFFPLAVVSVAAGISPIAAVEVALYDPAAYSAIIEEAHLSIAAFGVVFLMLVALSFFGDADKSDRWIPRLEGVLHQLGRSKVLPLVFALLIAVVFSFALTSAYRMDFLFAAACGGAAFLAVALLANVLDRPSAAATTARAGLGGFLYLEVIDASFSFDGVVGAFALTTNLFLIAIGLGIGAMYVRAFPIILVEQRTLTKYRCLESGALLSVLVLSAALLLQAAVHLHELLIGFASVSIICMAFLASLSAQE